MLELASIKKGFTRDGFRLEVLAGIDLEVRQGEFVSLLGPSGCGKTTLLNIISGLIPADSGRIILRGREVESCLGEVAYMQQNDLLLPWRTALANAILGPELRGVRRREAQERARALFAEFGLAGFEHRYPAELSGGMRQRIALIRTLLTEKELLLLDEPFGSLDAMTRGVLHLYLLRVWKEYEKTILFVTHDLEEALALSDRIYLLTSRPARVKAVLEVPLPRPRDRSDRQLVLLERELTRLVQEEIHEAFPEG